MDDLKREDVAAPDAQSQPVSDLETTTQTSVDDGTRPTEVKTTDSNGQTSVLQIFTDRALHFLAHASNEALGAVLAGLGASTYYCLLYTSDAADE